MRHLLPVPTDLESLLEKRDLDDRRLTPKPAKTQNKTDRRKSRRRESDRNVDSAKQKSKTRVAKPRLD